MCVLKRHKEKGSEMESDGVGTLKARGRERGRDEQSPKHPRRLFSLFVPLRSRVLPVPKAIRENE